MASVWSLSSISDAMLATLGVDVTFAGPWDTTAYNAYVISPAPAQSPVVTMVSQATRASGSTVSISSRIASEIWSATLSGWPSETDSEVKRKSFAI